MSTGAMVEPACRAWTCRDCGPRRARRFGLALDRAGYDRWLTVSKAPRDLLQGVSRLAYECRRSGPMEWAWSAEYNVNGMVHVHAVVRGWIEHRRDGGDSALDRACRQAGFGVVSWVERATGGAGSYSAKCAGYASKQSNATEAAYLEWVALNGGKRPWHWSRGYTGGAPMRDWIRTVLPSKDPGPWVPYTTHDQALMGAARIAAERRSPD